MKKGELGVILTIVIVIVFLFILFYIARNVLGDILG